jgi:nucleoside-diphosphate kinase
MPAESTLILIKPDAIAKRIAGTVLGRFEAAGFRIRAMKMLELDDDLLASHYAHIAHFPFFPAVRAFMQESPVIALVLEGHDAIRRVRDLLGPTDSTKAAPGTIRGDFGAKDADSKMRNVCHASDSPEAAAVEIARFFRPDEVFTGD